MSGCRHCLPVNRELMALPGHCPQQWGGITPPSDVEGAKQGQVGELRLAL